MALALGPHLMSLTDQLRYHPVDRRLRASYAGEPVLDTLDAMVVWEPRRVVPMYAVPRADLLATLVSRATSKAPEGLPPVLGPVNFGWHFHLGEAFDLSIGDTTVPDSAFPPADPDLGGRVVVEWAPFEWTEEEELVTGHPHDPFKRIDALPTSRHVVVSFEGRVLADSRRAVALYETHIPVRWYFPAADVLTDLLEDSDSVTLCAYKGQARWFSVTGAGEPGHDLAWTYAQPLHDAAPVKDHVAFYNERVDLVVDGTPVPRPVTPWSSPHDQETT